MAWLNNNKITILPFFFNIILSFLFYLYFFNIILSFLFLFYLYFFNIKGKSEHKNLSFIILIINNVCIIKK